MLTLVAAVLVYDFAYDTVVDIGDGRLGLPPLPSLSRKARSETRVENDMNRDTKWMSEDDGVSIKP